LAAEPDFRGKKTSLAHEEAISRNTQGGMMVKTPPTPPLEVVEAEFLLELLIIPLDVPACFGGTHQINQSRRCR